MSMYLKRLISLVRWSRRAGSGLLGQTGGNNIVLGTLYYICICYIQYMCLLCVLLVLFVSLMVSEIIQKYHFHVGHHINFCGESDLVGDFLVKWER